MSGKVVVLPGADLPGSGTPQPDVVEFCKDLLKKAKNGEITAVAVAGVHPSRTVFTAWTGSTRGHAIELSGAIAALEYRFHSTL